MQSELDSYAALKKGSVDEPGNFENCNSQKVKEKFQYEFRWTSES